MSRLVVLVIVAWVMATDAAAQTRPVALQDFYRIETVNGTTISRIPLS